ncbi:MAG: 30S ribosomal protein S1 [Acidobacteriota bacterium]
MSSMEGEPKQTDAMKWLQEDRLEPPTAIQAAQAGPSMEYEQLLDQYGGLDSFSEGDVVTGQVVKVTSNEVVIDVGLKSEGIIALQEFVEPDGKISVRPGDHIEVLIERAEDSEGRLLLSRVKVERQKAWVDIERAYQEQKTIEGIITERVKGGVSVDIGVKAFLPGSQIDLKPVKDLDALKGTPIQCRVIKINKKRGNIVLSRKAILEEELAEKKRRALETLQEGADLTGVVKNVTDYGVFIDLGGFDGLLHVTDISWGRISHPSRLFSIGSEIRVRVLKFDRERERVSLGYKQLYPDPWLTATERYHPGDRVTGTVVSVTDYGLFLEIEEGIEGLVHVSEMSWSKRAKAPSRLYSVGDRIDAVVLGISPEERKLSLGIKQIFPDPWQALAEKCQPGSILTGKVRNLTDFGAFIEVEDGIDGLVHISDLSWTKKVKHPSELLTRGDQVQAVVLSVDAEKRRLSLGIKQLQPDAWEQFFESKEVGDRVSGRVARFASFGAFVELEGGIEGLCHNSQLEFRAPGGNLAMPELGATYDFKIIRLQPQERKIGLSLRLAVEPGEVDNSSAFAARANSQSAPFRRAGGRLPQ